jgi:hypothetical protein
MVNFILLFASFIIHCQTNTFDGPKSCDICIIDSSCTEDKISFNVSISEHCRQPLNTHFTYHTDIYPKPHDFNIMVTCSNCYIDISLDPIHQAWDYTLTLKLPEPSKICSHQHVAHCGGDTSRLIWFILGGLSGLSVLFGVLVCSIKYYRGKKQPMITKKKTIEVAVINV